MQTHYYRNTTPRMQVINLRSGAVMRAMPHVLTPFVDPADRNSVEIAGKVNPAQFGLKKKKVGDLHMKVTPDPVPERPAMAGEPDTSDVAARRNTAVKKES